jgi:hypothetical protein
MSSHGRLLSVHRPSGSLIQLTFQYSDEIGAVKPLQRAQDSPRHAG